MMSLEVHGMRQNINLSYLVQNHSSVTTLFQSDYRYQPRINITTEF